MQFNTALNIIYKLKDNKPVKLKRGKYKAINIKSYNAITNCLFTVYDIVHVNIKYNSDNSQAYLTGIDNFDRVLFNNCVIDLY